MYLSRIRLDLGKRKTMLALADPALLHGAVEASFSAGKERRLWRIDPYRGGKALLLLSPTQPNLSALDEQFGMEEGWETLDYAPMLQRTVPDSVWRFRLCANPVKSVPRSDGRGKVHGHVTAEYQRQWLAERCEAHGFQLRENGFDVAGVQRLRFHKRDDPRFVTLLSVAYEGVLRVTDQALFNAALTEGIGRGKAYGNGLLTVMRVRDE